MAARRKPRPSKPAPVVVARRTITTVTAAPDCKVTVKAQSTPHFPGSIVGSALGAIAAGAGSKPVPHLAAPGSFVWARIPWAQGGDLTRVLFLVVRPRLFAAVLGFVWDDKAREFVGLQPMQIPTHYIEGNPAIGDPILARAKRGLAADKHVRALVQA